MKIHYTTDGKGRWWKRVWKNQCPEKVFLRGKCQGVEGHKGIHWCYSDSGDLCYSDNKQDSTEKGCSGSIPPDHNRYRSPKEMREFYYMTHFEDSEVLDTKEIEKLENGEFGGTSHSRPCTPEEIEKLKDRIKTNE